MKEALKQPLELPLVETLKQPLHLLPPEEGVDETAPVEEATGDAKKIVVPEGFEVTRLIYGADGEPTAVYIDRKRPYPLQWVVALSIAAGAIVGILIDMAINYLTGRA